MSVLAAGPATTDEVVPVEDPRDRRVARRATGLLREFNLAGALETADVHVAQRLARLGRDDDESVQLAVALTVRAVRSGSVCLDLSTVRDVGPELPWPEASAWRRALAASPLTKEVLRLDGELVYLDRYWAEEHQVVADLQARAAAPAPPFDEGRLSGALDAYFPNPAFADQRAAAENAVRHWTTVVTGGPGTGKTTTVARLLGVLMAAHSGDADGARDPDARPLRIALAAPTGKAAARMVEAVRAATRQEGFPADHGDAIRELTASTLHRLLGWRPDNSTRFRHDRHNRLPHDVVVVDETSMVSLSMTARLLEAVRPTARLVLVGDADQLASVDAGAVLKDLVEGLGTAGASAGPDERVGTGSPVSRLSSTRRFGEEIGGLAAAVRSGDADEAVERLRNGTAEVRWLDEAALPELLRHRAADLHGAADAGDVAGALRALEAHRLLCAHREGPYGVEHWNRVVERLLMEATGRDWLPDWYAGRPFVVNTNDYGLKLWNGDTGVVCRSGADLVAVIGDESAAGRRLPTTRLADVSTAHAMTVHRSQGSQFDEVTVLLPEPDSRILTRELFYTAVTRARSAVRVVGTEEAVRSAVTCRAQRATGRARRLGG